MREDGFPRLTALFHPDGQQLEANAHRGCNEHKPSRQGCLHRGIQSHHRMHVGHERLLQVYELDAGSMQHDGNGNVAGRPELRGGHEQPRLCRAVEHPLRGCAETGNSLPRAWVRVRIQQSLPPGSRFQAADQKLATAPNTPRGPLFRLRPGLLVFDEGATPGPHPGAVVPDLFH